MGAVKGDIVDVNPRLGDRSLFPALAVRAYLNHAAVSPPSQVVVARVNAALADYARGGIAGFMAWLPRRLRLKETLAGLVGAPTAASMCFVSNTTTGVIDIAQSLAWRPGDRVVLFEGEFPANVTPWQRAADRFELSITWVPIAPFERSVEEGMAALEEVLAQGPVRLVAVSAVQFQTGLRMPLPRIAASCRAHGAELFVDAIQAVGATPVDVGVGVDYLVAGGHKHLMGPEGAGFLYVAEERVPALQPHLAGWLSHEDALRFLTEGSGHLRYDRPVRSEADIFEQGTQPSWLLAGLEGATSLLATLGVEAIFTHVQRYLDELEPALVDRGFTSLRSADPGLRSTLLCALAPPGVDPVALHRTLAADGVACGFPDGRLRFSPHWPNPIDEVEHVIAAIDRALPVALR